MAETMHYHVMGVAGSGMSAIAHLLIDQGHSVSGCDSQANALTEELAARGATIQRGHDPAHLDRVDMLAISSAVRTEEPEVEQARARQIPVLKRSDIWRDWSERKPTLGVAGTHGKTTTTAMATLILERLGHDPAYIVPAGGPVPGLERFARWGSGPFVIEADEYDRLFLGLLPEVAIITSVDWDHVDIYPTPDDVHAAFDVFARQVRRTVVFCGDDPGAQRVRERGAGPADRWQGYGFAAGSAWRLAEVEPGKHGTEFTLEVPARYSATGRRGLRGRLRVPGKHNLQNAAGAIAAAAQFGVRPVDAIEVLAEFRGAARRFELKGEVRGLSFVDDYAHNPAKVAATLAAARERYGTRRLVVYFQPHTFSRTAALLEPLAASFGDADVVLVGEVYPSRERAADFPGIDAQLLVDQIRAQGAPGPEGTRAPRAPGKAEAAGGIAEAIERLMEEVRPGDVVLTLGAGDGYRVGDDARRRLGEL